VHACCCVALIAGGEGVHEEQKGRQEENKPEIAAVPKAESYALVCTRKTDGKIYIFFC